MTTGTLQEALKKLHENRELLEFVSKGKAVGALQLCKIDWDGQTAEGMAPDLSDLLVKNGWAQALDTRRIALAPKAVRFLFKLLVNHRLPVEDKLTYFGSLQPVELLAIGQDSLTFRAVHQLLGSMWVLKFSTLTSSVGAIEYFKRLATQPNPTVLSYPTDFGRTDLPSLLGDAIPCQCLVTPYWPGETLEAFFSKGPVLTPNIVVSFISTIAAGLAAIHSCGVAHNDLHAGNILVTKDHQGKTAFRIIDLTPSSNNPEPSQAKDIKDFQQHLVRLLTLVERQLTALSLRRHLGAEIYTLCTAILAAERLHASTILQWLHSKEPLKKWEDERRAFIDKEFPAKPNYLILRYEEFTNPRVAARFFIPYEPLQASLDQFAPIFLMGSRGSGKSSYLAAQAFFPEVEAPLVDFREQFGIYFACRQGELKPYAKQPSINNTITVRNCKSVLIVKIIRRLIELICQSVELKLIRPVMSIRAMREVLCTYIGEVSMAHFADGQEESLRELALVLTRVELKLKEEYLNDASLKAIAVPLDETDLQKFLQSTRVSVPELANTRFVLLFDDAGLPNLSEEMQCALNDLVLCRNSIFCCKISIEYHSYNFEGSGGKKLEMPHDYTRISISELMILRTGRNEPKAQVLEHFTKVINRRLEEFDFASNDIEDYLGYAGPGESKKLISSLRRAGGDVPPSNIIPDQNPAIYHGWQTVTKLSDRTLRHLLQLVEAIFEEGGITADTDIERKGIVAPARQSKAIKDFSADKLRTLGYVGGVLILNGRKLGVGAYLVEFVGAFGAISRHFLRHAPPRRLSRGGLRFKEVLAIEVNTAPHIRPEAEAALHELVRYGVLDDSVLQLTRDDRTKKPIYVLNKIYTPALAISFRRQEDWRLSKTRFEQLLVDPNQEARRVIDRLRNNKSDGGRSEDVQSEFTNL